MSENLPRSPIANPPRTVNLKDRWFAAVLAWLVPGLGHLYQGRIFKALIFSVCILGTFFSGVCLGDGKVVNWNWKTENRTYGYFAQVLVGIPAIPARIQAYRQPPELIAPDRSNLLLEQPLKGEFEGTLTDLRIGEEPATVANVIGKVEIKPATAEGFERRVTGTFKGVIHAVPGEPLSVKPDTTVELNLTMLRDIEPNIYPSPNREISCDFEGKVLDASGASLRGGISGQILNSRSFWDRYDAPLDDRGLEEAHGNLGKYFELGLVYTWIAGFLNLLAIWDAFEGPANGYREEDDPLPPAQ